MKNYWLSLIPFYGIYHFLFKVDDVVGVYGLKVGIHPFFPFVWALAHVLTTINCSVRVFNYFLM